MKARLFLVPLLALSVNFGCSKKSDDEETAAVVDIVAGKLDIPPAKAIAYVDTAYSCESDLGFLSEGDR